MILRACIDCGALSNEIHCPDHRASKVRNGSTRQWRKIRAAVLERDDHRCFYCGEPATTVDHLRPLSRGGTDVEANLVAACTKCNGAKADKTPAEYGLTNNENENVDNLALQLGSRGYVGGQPH